MKSGDDIHIELIELTKPWVGHLVEITFANGIKVKARIISVDETGAKLTVVSPQTKT